MATLRHSSGREEILRSESQVGRSQSAAISLPSAWVSSQHAVIRWNGSSWEVRDAGSRNGTYVNGRSVEAGRWVPLQQADRVAFGRIDDEWEVWDVSSPAPFARSGRTLVRSEDGLLVLPSAEQPELLVYCKEDGIWVAERGDDLEIVGDGRTVLVGDEPWQLFLPLVIPATRDARARLISRCKLYFQVSQDEEHVDIVAETETGQIAMAHRAHHDLLLTLARARLEDTQRNTTPISEHGWLYQEEVARDLKIRQLHFNMAIHRARAQFREAGFVDAEDLFERRRGSGQIRIGVPVIEVRAFEG